MRIKRCSFLLVALVAVSVISPLSANASFAGKNGRIFFESNTGPTGYFTDIFSMTPRGTDVHPVRMLGEWQHDPTVSPNGRWVSFSSEPEEPNPPANDGCGEMFCAMRIHGGSLTTLDDAPTFTRNGFSVWPASTASSSDGRRIAWLQDDGTIEQPNLNLYAARADGGNTHRLTNRAGAEGAPDFAPSGRRIVFSAETKAGDKDIFEIRSDGSGLRHLTRGPANQSEPDYAPNGAWIVYAQQQRAGAKPDIFKMRSDGSNQRPLYDRLGLSTDPDWGIRPRG